MYCLHPRVIVLSLVPVIAMAVLSLALGRFYWESAVAAVRASLEGYELVNATVHWLQEVGMGGVQEVLAPALLLFLAIPVIVMITLLAVSLFMTPAMVTLVADRRFPQLARKKGATGVAGLGWALGSTALAAMVLLVTVPLWLVSPLMLILPPLVWGWLTYRVMAFDALADHASAQERRQLLKEHQGPLLAMGLFSGYLGTAPSLVWASGAMLMVMAPILVPAAIWLYTLVFAFSSLWFAHYCLAALEQLRKKSAAPAPAPAPTPLPPSPLEHAIKISIHQEPLPPPPSVPPPAKESPAAPGDKPAAVP